MSGAIPTDRSSTVPSAEEAAPNPGFPRRRRGECPDLEVGMTCTTRRDGIASFASGIRRLVASLGPDPASLFGAVLTWPLRIASTSLLQSTVFFAGSSAMPFAAAHGLLLADIVAKLENQASLKISQKAMFRRHGRCNAPCIPTRGTKVPDRPDWFMRTARATIAAAGATTGLLNQQSR